ncbi:alternative sulfate transporter [Verticillium alfalfae VaMs.102]|uniref:Alternative sulfate transporter n=1 Tax=Verticillium alfalfae (strain VaMs.102 / ATCC MYA-4576 / FGSC 10136) TaxID=526221 RepID=C9SSW4_VERA1|nr:alternative sulfate transporter [Verticillium alfalfae VaMs.102]EEY21879.1 alternative sulfate transporter [Verticillium alfalfae VaMs.102]
MAEPKSDRVNTQLTSVPPSVDEKHSQTSPHFGSGPESERQIPERTWTDAEEKAPVRKADCIVMPLLMFAFFVLQLDRSNAGNALTDGFLKDVGRLLESGYIPGGLYTLSLWYKGPELSKRFALYFMGNGFATASGGLLAYGILQMRGVAGLAGWQWLFILEGLLTLVAGFCFFALFPGVPSNPVSLLGVRLFTDREITILRDRIIIDDPNKATTKTSINLGDLQRAVADYKLWPHILLTSVGLAPSIALWSYAPSIVNSFGYERLQSNALTSVGQWMGVALTLFLGWLAKHQIWLIDNGCGNNLMVACCHGSWLSLNAQTPSERAMRMACFIMSANVAGLIGAQLFRADDRPFYHRGWTIAVVFMALSVACVLLLIALYHRANKKYFGKVQSSEAGSEEARPIGDELIVSKPYNY